jgi:hypothetical protein
MSRSNWFACVTIATSAVVGCNSADPKVEDSAFREAIRQYLQANNMAMTIKEVKEGPTIEGDVATLSASMTHEKLGGPSVTWNFQFSRQPDGSWEVTDRH